MYRVVKFFADLQDGNHTYNVGDKFPRDGYTPSNDRINELLSSTNKQGTPVIKFVDEEDEVVKATEPADEETAYTEESLSEMTTKEIKALAEKRGYKITKNNKSDVIEQFLTQQR